jgi:hypothetical protein
MAVPGANAPASIALRVTEARKPHHDKAEVFEEVLSLLLNLVLSVHFG